MEEAILPESRTGQADTNYSWQEWWTVSNSDLWLNCGADGDTASGHRPISNGTGSSSRTRSESGARLKQPCASYSLSGTTSTSWKRSSRRTSSTWISGVASCSKVSLSCSLLLIPAHYSKEETEWSKKTYEAWLEARAKLGLSGADTSFVDDKDEAERVRLHLNGEDQADAQLSRFKGVTSVLRRPTGSVHSWVCRRCRQLTQGTSCALHS